jgi:hypothetical protein
MGGHADVGKQPRIGENDEKTTERPKPFAAKRPDRTSTEIHRVSSFFKAQAAWSVGR